MARTSRVIPESLPDIWRLIWTWSDRYVKRRLALVLLLTIAAAAVTATAPIALKFAIDALTSRPSEADLVFLVIGLYIFALWSARNLSELRVLLHGQADRKLYRSLSDRLFSHVMQLPLRFHMDRQTGGINETLSNGLLGYQMVLQVVVYTLLPVVVQLGIVATVLIHLKQPIFTGLFVVAMLLYTVAFARGTLLTLRAATQASDAQVEARGVMTDALLNYETVKFFSAEAIVRDRVDRANGRTESEWLGYYKKRFFTSIRVAAIYATFLAAAVGYAGLEVFRARMSVGEFVLINSYMLQLVTPLETMGFAMQQLSQGVAFLQKMLDLFREPTESQVGSRPSHPHSDSPSSDPAGDLLLRQARKKSSSLALLHDEGERPSPSPRSGEGRAEESNPMARVAAKLTGGECQHSRGEEMPAPGKRHEDGLPAIPGRLEFRNVSVAYRADRAVLKDVSFEIPAGKTLGIVGESGAGKSTIVRLLVRLLEVNDGCVLLDGVPITLLPLPVLRHSIAVVPQDTVLFNDSIAYNIGFGRRGSSQEEIERAAGLAHLHEFVMSLPEKYQTRVGERGVKLSGGERQRVSIARAAIKQPRIYVFDEATSSLDSRTESEIMQNLREIARESTTMVIAHRLSTVVHADEIVVLEAGAIVERGTHFALLRADGRYARLWEAQSGTSPVVIDAQAANEG